MIQRYRCELHGEHIPIASMAPYPAGVYVSYLDHIAAITPLVQALRAYSLHFNNLRTVNQRATRATADALLDKYKEIIHHHA